MDTSRVHLLAPAPAFAAEPPPPLAKGGASRQGQPEDASFIRMMMAINEVSDDQINDMLSTIDAQSKINREAAKEALVAAEKAAKAAAKQSETSWVSFAFGIIGDVLLAVAAVALTFVTAGASTPLLLMALASVVLSAWDIAAKIHEKTTGTDNSLSGLMARAARELGADEETAGYIAMGVSFAIRIVLAFGSIAAAFKNGAAMAGKSVSFLHKISTASGIVAQMGGTGAGVYGSYQGNEAKNAKLDENTLQMRSNHARQYVTRTLSALEGQLTDRQEFMRSIRKNLEVRHESRNMVFNEFV